MIAASNYPGAVFFLYLLYLLPLVAETIYKSNLDDTDGEVVLRLGHSEVVEHADDLSRGGIVRTKTVAATDDQRPTSSIFKVRNVVSF